MSDKQVMNSYFKIYWGIWFSFSSALSFTVFENSFSLTAMDIALAAVVFSLPFFHVFFSLRELKRNGRAIKIDVKTLKDAKLIPLVAGFVLMAVGIGFLAVSQPTIYADGTPTGLFWHPFVNQAFILFFAGTGIQLLEWVWYYDSVSSKIVQEAKTNPRGIVN